MTLVWVLLGRIYLVIHTRQHLWRCGGVVLGYAFAIILFRRRACFRPPEYPSFRQVRVGISGGFCIQGVAFAPITLSLDAITGNVPPV